VVRPREFIICKVVGGFTMLRFCRENNYGEIVYNCHTYRMLLTM
jgi:hypothetical protein